MASKRNSRGSATPPLWVCPNTMSSFILGLQFEALESRVLMSGSNALDRIDFGNVTSETANSFDLGFSTIPLGGVGALGQTFRAPVGTNATPIAGTNNELQFTLAVNSTQQNYLTIRLWGGDTTPSWISLLGADSELGVVDSNNNSGPAPFPNRFYYDTFPIALSLTQGKTSVQLTLYENNVTTTAYYARPIYSAYTTTDPDFIPDSADPTGTPISQTGQVTSYSALTAAQVLGTTASPGILLANRQAIYGTGGYYDQTIADQIITPADAVSGVSANAASTAPPEVNGLDLWTNVASWSSSSETADNWRDQVGGGSHGAGYSTTPEPLLSLLSNTYELQPFTDANGNTVSGLDHYHDPAVLQRLVYALDGTTYLLASDGGIQNDGPTPNIWQGLTSTPRATGHGYAGSTARGGGWGLSLEGVDDQSIGEAIITILNDPVGAAAFETYLSQSFDANLTSQGYNTGPTSVVRAYAYEQMLYNNMNYLLRVNGGTESQSMFEEVGMYADQVALEKLQALYPNSAYPSQTPDTAFSIVEQIIGLIPWTFSTGGPGSNPGGVPNYGLTSAGLGEAGGANSSGYDGRYGSILPWIAPVFVQLTQADPGLTSSVDKTAIAQITIQARATIDAYDQFISAGENYTGVSDSFVLTQEDFITYRDPYNPNSNGFHFTLDSLYEASDPSVGIDDADALRSAYLETQYALPGTPNVPDYGRGLANYENTLRSLINVNPATLTALPGEPGQPNHAWADVQNGTVSAYYDGERFYLNTNWRNGNGDFGTPSEFARVHDTTATMDKAATIYLPYNSATVQSDGNLSASVPLQPWFVRYGNWLCAFDNSTSSTTVKLPAGTGQAVDLLTGTVYAMGSTIALAAGHSMVIYLVPGVVSEPIANGTYFLYNGTSHFTLGDPSGSTSTGTRVDQELINSSSTNQQWIFTYNGSGYYTVKNVASNLYLDDPSGQTATGTILDQATASNADNQLWQIVPSGGSFALFNKFSGLVVDDPSFATASGSGQDLATSTGNQNQAWSLISAVTATQPIANGTYTLTLALDGLSMDGQSGVAQNTPSNTAATQQWTFTYNGNGFYTIKNVGANAYLSGINGGLSLVAATGGTEQLWQLIRDGIGFQIVCDSNKGAINDGGGSFSVGNALINYTGGSGGLNQNWVPFLYIGVAASPNPVTGTTSTLTASVTTDASTAAGLIYTWSGTGPALGLVSFSANGTNAASTATATFTRAGIYNLLVTVTNSNGTFVSSGTLTITVNQTSTAILVTPTSAVLNQRQADQFSASVVDQFGFPLPIQPTITFSLGTPGQGTITADDGLYIAPAASGSTTIVATASGGLTASVPITITDAVPLAPTALSSSTVNAGRLKLTWTVSALTQTYTILRSTTANGTLTAVATGVTGTTYTDSGLAASTTYYYYVVAVNGSFTSPQFNQTSAKTSAPASLDSSGTYIGTAGSYNNQGNVGTNTFDGSLATYFDGPDGTGDWVGLDFGPGVKAVVDTIKYCPRSGYPQRMLNDVFEGSDDPTFTTGVTTLYTVTTQPAQNTLTSVTINNANGFKYLRYYDPAGNECDVAEVQFFGYTINTLSPPTIATQATAIPNGTTASLSVLGSDVAGESTLTYNWTFTGPGPATVSANNSNAAKNITANFIQAGIYTAAVTMTDSNGLSTTNLTTISVNFGAFTNSVDIGTPTPTGSLSYVPSTGVYTSTGSGDDIWNASDQFHFSYGTLTSSGSIIAQVTGVSNTNSNAKVGVMVRASAAANSAYANVWVSPSNVVNFEARSNNGSSAYFVTNSPTLASLPYLRLVRSGTNVSASYSINGSSWTQLGSTQTISLGTGAALAGLAVCAHNNGTLDTATFANVLISSNAVPSVATAATASPSTITGTTASLSVLGADDGGEPNLTYTWSAALVPSGATTPKFSINGNNAAKNTVATFVQAGSYVLAVTITEGSGLTTNSIVNVTLSQSLTSIVVSPSGTGVNLGGSEQFLATALDQFGNAMSSQPTFTWSVPANSGTILSTGKYTAPSVGGNYTITAASGSITDSVNISVVPIAYTTGNIYYVELTPDQVTEQIWVGSNGIGTPTYLIGINLLSSLTFNGGPDTLTVNYSNGNPIPAGGISFTGGSGIDSLSIIGSSGNDTITVNPTTIAFNSDALITYASLQSILINGMTGADVITQSAQPGGAAVLAVLPTSADTLNINGGSFSIPPPASGSGFNSYPLAALNLAAGSSLGLGNAAAHSDRTILVLGTESIAPTGTLDLGSNDLIIHHGSLSGITSQIRSGYNAAGGGNWNGMGITSSTAAANSPRLTALGVILNNSGSAIYTLFDNQPVSATDVLVKYTYIGDANLDGAVDGSDYTKIDYGFNSHLTGWFNGDFNYDAVIDGNDYTLVDNAFNTQGVSMAALITTTTEIDQTAVTMRKAKVGSTIALPAASLVIANLSSQSETISSQGIDQILDSQRRHHSETFLN